MLGNKEKTKLCLQYILQTYLPVEINFKITVTSKSIMHIQETSKYRRLLDDYCYPQGK